MDFQAYRLRSGITLKTPMRADGAAYGKILAPTQHRDILPSSGFGGAGQQAPRFAVFLVLALAATSRIEVQRSSTREGLDGNYVPQVLPHHVRCQEIDTLFGVAAPTASGPRLILPRATTGRAFHLDAPKPLSHSHQHIVRVDVSPRFRHPKIKFAGSGDKSRLVRVAQTATTGATDGMDGDHLRYCLIDDADDPAGP